MYKIKLMNKISSVGTALFNQDYLVGEDQKDASAHTGADEGFHSFTPGYPRGAGLPGRGPL